MQKIRSSYHGGIHSGIQLAIADETGTVYIRMQDKTQWGWQYGPWHVCGNFDQLNPLTVECGFSTLRRDATPARYRLPINARVSRLQLTIEKDCDQEHESAIMYD